MNNTVAEEHTIARAETQKHRNTEEEEEDRQDGSFYFFYVLFSFSFR
mgnify:CR=1 FL=1